MPEQDPPIVAQAQLTEIMKMLQMPGSPVWNPDSSRGIVIDTSQISDYLANNRMPLIPSSLIEVRRLIRTIITEQTGITLDERFNPANGEPTALVTNQVPLFQERLRQWQPTGIQQGLLAAGLGGAPQTPGLLGTNPILSTHQPDTTHPSAQYPNPAGSTPTIVQQPNHQNERRTGRRNILIGLVGVASIPILAEIINAVIHLGRTNNSPQSPPAPRPTSRPTSTRQPSPTQQPTQTPPPQDGVALIVRDAVTRNEIGNLPPNNPYPIYGLSLAEGGTSGYSYGRTQEDIANNQRAYDVFSNILNSTIPESGLTKPQVNSILSVIGSPGYHAIVDQHTTQINNALSSDYGKQQIDALDNERFAVITTAVKAAIDTIRTNHNGGGDVSQANIGAHDGKQMVAELAMMWNRNPSSITDDAAPHLASLGRAPHKSDLESYLHTWYGVDITPQSQFIIKSDAAANDINITSVNTYAEILAPTTNSENLRDDDALESIRRLIASTDQTLSQTYIPRRQLFSPIRSCLKSFLG